MIEKTDRQKLHIMIKKIEETKDFIFPFAYDLQKKARYYFNNNNKRRLNLIKDIADKLWQSAKSLEDMTYFYNDCVRDVNLKNKEIKKWKDS